MKTVLLVRHAKSSWDNITLNDSDRPLNDRGKKNAPEMAERLLARNISIDSFISSPAKRARKTAEIFSKTYKKNKDKILIIPDLYGATPEAFENAIAAAPSNASSIAIFSHNPGITDFVNTLTEVRIDNMPTCSVFAVKTHIDRWEKFREASKEFYFFDYPKNKESDD